MPAGARRRVTTVLGVGALVLPLVAALALPATATAPSGPTNARLTNDAPGAGGYTSNYTAVTGTTYTDPTLTECSRSRGRENEPSVAIDPRNRDVLVGSSNDYCGVYNAGVDASNAPIPAGPIWLGYYRSQNGGASFQSSLLPGYPGDTSPYAARSQVRTGSAGDAVLAWDGDGRLFAGSESSGDADGTKKGFGDVFVATYENPAGASGATANDGKEFRRAVIVDPGTSSPDHGKFNDKTSLAVDRTASAQRGNVYFAYSRFVGGGSNIYFSRSTDHGVGFSHPILLTGTENNVQFPDISINRDGTVTVTWVSTLTVNGAPTDAVRYAVSRDGGATFGKPATVTTFTGYSAQDAPSAAAASAVSEPDPTSPDAGEAATGSAHDCGVLTAACDSGYHFFRRDTQARSTADQTANNHTVYVVLDPSVPGSETPTGTSYGSIRPGTGSQSAIYAVKLDVLTGATTGPVRIKPEKAGHQLFPDIAVDGGVVHVLWWDSRNDTCYSPARPVGNCADRTVTPSLDVYGAQLSPTTLLAGGERRLTTVTSQPNVDQFGGRTVPFAGDYLWIDAAAGTTYGVWTDYRNTVAGDDPRTTGTTGDVLQCRTQRADGTWTGDTCPRAGGLDQDIYGALAP
jgi:hypothetical protein